MGVNPTLLFTVINIDIGSFEAAELKAGLESERERRLDLERNLDAATSEADQSKRASDDAKDQM